MIVVTGAAGFIGGCLLTALNRDGMADLVLVDDFTSSRKARNYEGKRFRELVPRSAFFSWVAGRERSVTSVVHLGARTDTAETDAAIFDELNVRYSQSIWRLCARFRVPLVYASSAATYGLGENGFLDDHALVPHLKPRNAYAQSKNEFDRWALAQTEQPPSWIGLKFFNVYGPNEAHKGKMASVVFHAYRQIHATGELRLFRSHHPDFADGEQRRDFVYVKDVTDVIRFFMDRRCPSGLYNVGTGVAQTFKALAAATFASLGRQETIVYIDTPEAIRGGYQYFTEADVSKLRGVGYASEFRSLERGVVDYVERHLLPDVSW